MGATADGPLGLSAASPRIVPVGFVVVQSFRPIRDAVGTQSVLACAALWWTRGHPSAHPETARAVESITKSLGNLKANPRPGSWPKYMQGPPLRKPD